MMVNESSNAALMSVFAFAERQGFSYQIWTSLPQGIVESLDVRGLSGFLPHCSVPLAR